MCDKWNRVDLRIASNLLDIDDISRILGVEPTTYYLKGDLMSPNNQNSSKYESNVWILSSALEEKCELSKHIEAMIDFMELKRDGIAKIIEKCDMDIFCGCYSESGQGGFVLEPQLMKRVADIGIPLIVNI